MQGDAFTHKSLHTGRGLYSEMVLHRGMILQRDASTRKCSHTEMLSTQRYFYTHRCFRTQIPLHRDRWAKRNFLMQARLHKGAFTQRCVYTQVFLHTNTCTQCFCILLRKHTLTHTQWQVLSAHILLHVDVFNLRGPFFSHAHTRASSFTEMFLNFKHACFYTEIFATEILLHTGAITNRGSLQRNAFTRGAFTYRRSYADILLHDLPPRTPMSRERVQQADAKSQVHGRFW